MKREEKRNAADRRIDEENRFARCSVGKIMEASITEQIARISIARSAPFFRFNLSFIRPLPARPRSFFLFCFYFLLFQCLSVNFAKQSSGAIRHVVLALRADRERVNSLANVQIRTPMHEAIETKEFFFFFFVFRYFSIVRPVCYAYRDNLIDARYNFKKCEFHFSSDLNEPDVM